MKCWQWDDHKSITLTRYVVALAILGSAVMTVCGPWLVRWLMTTHHLNQEGPAVEVVLLVLGYLCAALAFWMLYNLYRFLGRLEQGEVFVPQTVLALRRISWCCTWGGGALPAGGDLDLSALRLSGGGGRVHGAAGAGAEKRLCPGRADEGRTGLYHIKEVRRRAHRGQSGCDDGAPP